LAFPNNKNLPAKFPQQSDIRSVARYIFIQFDVPILTVAHRARCAPAAWMLMPKAAMNENHSSTAWQRDIRRSGKVSSVQSETEA
jgi:hypothetical protein